MMSARTSPSDGPLEFPSVARSRINASDRECVLPADCERRERQRQMKSDGAQRSPALREGAFPRRRTGGWQDTLTGRRA